MNPALRQFVNSFTVGLSLRAIYFVDHPSVLEAARGAAAALAELAARSGPGPVSIGQARERLVYEGRTVLALTPIARRLIEFLKGLDAGAFRFARETTAEELLELFSIGAELRGRCDRGAARAQFLARGITHVELAPPFIQGGGTGAPADPQSAAAPVALVTDDLSESDVKAYHSLMAVVDSNHVQAARAGGVDVAAARAQAEQLVEKDLLRLHDLMRLAHYPDFDVYTVGHSVRVALLATLVTESVGLAKERMVELAAAALLHDVGKAQVPQQILFKPGALDADERRAIEEHPRLGGEILIASGEANPWSVCAAFGHHVRHDERGYPRLPPWVKSTSATRLIHVCDVFEALTAVRPYKPALAPWQAYELMVRDHGAFDPAALRAFVTGIGLHPPGSNVVLSDGSEGVVVRAGARCDRPVVQIRRRADGVALDVSSAESWNLSDREHEGVHVVRLLPSTSDDEEGVGWSGAPPGRRDAPATAVAPIAVDSCDPTAAVAPRAKT